MVSFSWGIFVFHERVQSLASALFAIFLMICGIFGMSFASAPQKKGDKKKGGPDGPVFSHADSDGGNSSNAIFCFSRGCLGDRVLTWSEERQRSGGRGKRTSERDSSDKLCNMSDDENESAHSFADEEQPAGSQSQYELTPRVSKNGKRNRDAMAQLERFDGDASSSNTNLPLLDHNSADSYRTEKLRPPRRSNSNVTSEPPRSAPSPLSSLCTTAGSPAVVQSRNVVSRMDSFQDDVTKKIHADIEDNDTAADEAHPSGKDKGISSMSSNGGAEAIVKGMCRHLKVHYGIDISTRQMGLLIAGFGSIWGGSVMVPLHYAGESAQGLGFVFSFAMGATLVNAMVWVVCFLDALRRHGCDCGAAISSLPKLHLSKLILPGSLSGTLWSIGNMASMISVTFLGEGVGYSMTQSAMLISGLWGIFFFKEIKSPAKIRAWLASACLTISGILLLSYNHLPPSAPVMLKKNSF
mmetsp:Transcript_29502/g.59851  ORF Transcript_29502/g.59851 Transcript_29502/m.59851 type:complete len:468 (-) Transcript_29502:98-1501(-)